jgi:hypothetical protein
MNGSAGEDGSTARLHKSEAAWRTSRAKICVDDWLTPFYSRHLRE